MEIVGLKIGGSIATYKDVESFPLSYKEIKEKALDYIRVENLKRIGEKEILPALEKISLFIGLGVGPFGHYLVENWNKLENKEIVHRSVAYYCKLATEILKEVGLPVTYEEKFSPRKTCYYNNQELNVEKLKEWVLEKMEKGKVPVFHGDMIPCRGRKAFDGLDVLSADKSLPQVAIELKARRIVAACDIDGLYDEDPKINPSAKFIPIIETRKEIKIKEDRRKGDVTGRMPKKVEELKRAASFGIEARIVNGLVEGRIRKALLGEECKCTLILP
jgi:isopentenyl phosphate kinase